MTRNWDGSPESDRDSMFHDLRDSGWRGPIDQDGNKVDDIDRWIDEQLQRWLTFVPHPMTVYEAIVKLTSKQGLPAPAASVDKTGTQPSVEDESREWPVDGEE